MLQTFSEHPTVPVSRLTRLPFPFVFSGTIHPLIITPRPDTLRANDRVKMGETPLPDYIVDMLRKSGDVDKDGKPVNDPFDPWDVEDMEGSRRIRDRENEAEVTSPFLPLLLQHLRITIGPRIVAACRK